MFFRSCNELANQCMDCRVIPRPVSVARSGQARLCRSPRPPRRNGPPPRHRESRDPPERRARDVAIHPRRGYGRQVQETKDMDCFVASRLAMTSRFVLPYVCMVESPGFAGLLAVTELSQTDQSHVHVKPSVRAATPFPCWHIQSNPPTGHIVFPGTPEFSTRRAWRRR